MLQISSSVHCFYFPPSNLVFFAPTACGKSAHHVLTKNLWLTELSGQKADRRKMPNYVSKGVGMCAKKFLSSNSEESLPTVRNVYIYKESVKAVWRISRGSIWKVGVGTGVGFLDIAILGDS